MSRKGVCLTVWLNLFAMATLGVVLQRFKQQSIHELSARTKTSGCCARRPLGFTVLFYFNINHLRPNIQIQILQTDLHIFPYRISWANLFVDQGFSHQVMILLTLTTFSLNYLLMLFGENWLWSLLGPKGLSSLFFLQLLESTNKEQSEALQRRAASLEDQLKGQKAMKRIK